MIFFSGTKWVWRTQSLSSSISEYHDFTAGIVVAVDAQSSNSGKSSKDFTESVSSDTEYVRSNANCEEVQICYFCYMYSSLFHQPKAIVHFSNLHIHTGKTILQFVQLWCCQVTNNGIVLLLAVTKNFAFAMKKILLIDL